MPPTTHAARVDDFLAQKRIAIAGVSRDQSRHPVGNAIFKRLKKLGREVFPVNPNMTEFEGVECYPGVGAIPGGVDAVVIITRPEVTDTIVKDCAAAGVRRVWMHQSSAKSSSVSPQAVDFCRREGVDVIPGHKCMKWMLGLSGGLPA
jgi:predicted CoA-binding protein